MAESRPHQTDSQDEAAVSPTGFEHNTIHNSSVHVNSLPVEVLCEIFFRLARAGVRPWGEGPSYRWVREINICRHWRNVAVAYPRLWSYINPRSPREWREVLFQRSQSVSLVIAGEFLVPVEGLERGLERARQLEIRIPGGGWSLIKTYLNLAKTLETLWVREGSDSSLPESPPLVIENSARLRRLDLYCTQVHGLLLPSLTELRLICPPERMSVTSLVSVLRNLPSLQHLQTMAAISSESSEPRDPVEHAHFPSLRYLILQEPVKGPNCALFLQSISFPSSAVFYLLGTAWDTRVEEYDHLHRVIAAKSRDSTYCTPLQQQICSLGDNDKGESYNSDKLTCRVWAEFPASMTFRNCLSITIVWSRPTEGNLAAPAMSLFKCFLPALPHLHTIRCERNSEATFNPRMNSVVTTADYCDHLSRLPALCKLHVCWQSEVGMRALVDTLAGNHTAFPRLHKLVLSDVKWARHPSQRCAGVTLLPRVLDMLVSRKARGMPVWELELDMWQTLNHGEEFKEFIATTAGELLVEKLDIRMVTYVSKASDCST